MRGCAFCGETPLTLEHLWPIWVRETFYGDEKRKTPATEHVIVNQGGRNVRYQPSLGYKARALCEKCNQGWTADFNESARPFVQPMLRGERTPLDAVAQKRVAKWATKTAMVFLHTTPAQPIPLHHYRYLKLHHRPPPSSQIWLGFRTGEEGISGAGFQSFGIRDSPEALEKKGDAYLVTIGIGYLVFVLFGHNLAFEIPWSRQFLQPIWPVTQSTVIWPPKHVFGSIFKLAYNSELERHLTLALATRGITLARL